MEKENGGFFVVVIVNRDDQVERIRSYNAALWK